MRTPRPQVRRLLELAERASERWDVSTSDFLTPAVAADAMSCLQRRSDIVAVPWGGYAGAERVRCGLKTLDTHRTGALHFRFSPEVLCGVVLCCAPVCKLQEDPGTAQRTRSPKPTTSASALPM